MGKRVCEVIRNKCGVRELYCCGAVIMWLWHCVTVRLYVSVTVSARAIFRVS